MKKEKRKKERKKKKGKGKPNSSKSNPNLCRNKGRSLAPNCTVPLPESFSCRALADVEGMPSQARLALLGETAFDWWPCPVALSFPFPSLLATQCRAYGPKRGAKPTCGYFSLPCRAGVADATMPVRSGAGIGREAFHWPY